MRRGAPIRDMNGVLPGEGRLAPGGALLWGIGGLVALPCVGAAIAQFGPIHRLAQSRV